MLDSHRKAAVPSVVVLVRCYSQSETTEKRNQIPGEQIIASRGGGGRPRPGLCITIKNNINWNAPPFPEQPIIRLDKKLAVSKSYKCLN